jgi:epoxyqueuosine reductase
VRLTCGVSSGGPTPGVSSKGPTPGDQLERLRRIGVQLHGVADGSGWAHVLPGCRSVVVVGSGGRALWDALVARELRGPDPLDALVAEAVLEVGDQGGRWVRCAADEPEPVDFRRLALAAGLGWPSRLGLVLHPVYGPWFALRAAWFTREVLPPTGPLPEPGPCGGCDAPCRSSCPVRAPDPAGFAIGACIAHRRSGACATACDARRACPVGAAHRYPAEQERYHLAAAR